MNIALLADKSATIAKSYGVYNEETGIPFRGLFIIDDKGTLRQVTINDLPVGRSVDETLRLVQAFQFTDKHGEGMFMSLCHYFNYIERVAIFSSLNMKNSDKKLPLYRSTVYGMFWKYYQ